MVSDSQIFNHSFGTATLQTDSQQPTIDKAMRKPSTEKDPFGHSSSDEEGDEEEAGDLGPDGEVWARAQVEEYILWCKGGEARPVRNLDWDGVLDGWRGQGRNKFPFMFLAFQSLLAVGAGAADSTEAWAPSGPKETRLAPGRFRSCCCCRAIWGRGV